MLYKEPKSLICFDVFAIESKPSQFFTFRICQTENGSLKISHSKMIDYIIHFKHLNEVATHLVLTLESQAHLQKAICFAKLRCNASHYYDNVFKICEKFVRNHEIQSAVTIKSFIEDSRSEKQKLTKATIKTR